MSKKYTEKEILDRLVENVNPKMISSLYRKGFIKYEGYTRDTKKHYYDVIAKYLIDYTDLFNEDNIDIPSRQSYKAKDHKKLTDNERSLINKKKRGEEWFARSLLESRFDLIGEIIDYQIPLKGKDKKNVGKIDLLAYNDKKNEFSLIELKREYNTETILRAILEICTYYYQINKEQLKTDYKKQSDAAVRKVVLIFKDSPQHKQYKDSGFIRKLSEKLNVEVFILDYIINTP